MISLKLFNEIYTEGRYDDPHQELANRLGVTRQEAKKQVYIHLYSQPLNKQFKSDSTVINIDFNEIEKRVTSWILKKS